MKKKRGKKKIFLILLGILLLIIAFVAVYFLLIRKIASSFGFNLPDFSSTVNLGDTIGKILNANVWEDVKLNPFGE